MGLNGVDNGQLWFDHVRVPRDALLDAFASVDDQASDLKRSDLDLDDLSLALLLT